MPCAGSHSLTRLDRHSHPCFHNGERGSESDVDEDRSFHATLSNRRGRYIAGTNASECATDSAWGRANVGRQQRVALCEIPTRVWPADLSRARLQLPTNDLGEQSSSPALHVLGWLATTGSGRRADPPDPAMLQRVVAAFAGVASCEMHECLGTRTSTIPHDITAVPRTPRARHLG